MRLGGRVVARIESGDDVDAVLSPRPYLHPVTTLAGTVTTDTLPADHLHHLGLGVALPDVNGTSHWGGRTYVRGTGSVMLANHGRQRRDGVEVEGGLLRERLTWLDEHGAAQLGEHRETTGEVVRVGADEAWMLGWRSLLTANFGALEFGSPATKGRVGAGYGGVFWRFPDWAATVVTADGAGEDNAHGSRSPWLAVTDASRATTVLLMQPVGPRPRPWFARVAEYLGVGPALAWDEPFHVAEGDSVELGLDALLLDRAVVDPDELAALALRFASGRRIRPVSIPVASLPVLPEPPEPTETPAAQGAVR
nr:PmoA family protein [Agromyces seonyuensis]